MSVHKQSLVEGDAPRLSAWNGRSTGNRRARGPPCSTFALAAALWLNRAAVLSILPANADDIPVLRDLARRIWHEHYPGIITRDQIDYMLAGMYDARTLHRELAEGVAWFLVRHGLEPVGFMAFAFDPVSLQVKLHKLYLLPRLHGQGLGRQMLEHVRAQAVFRGAGDIRLQVNKQNTRAIRAYERAGFRIREGVVADIGGGFVMDDFVMVLTLEAGSAGILPA